MLQNRRELAILDPLRAANARRGRLVGAVAATALVFSLTGIAPAAIAGETPPPTAPPSSEPTPSPEPGAEEATPTPPPPSGPPPEPTEPPTPDPSEPPVTPGPTDPPTPGPTEPPTPGPTVPPTPSPTPTPAPPAAPAPGLPEVLDPEFDADDLLVLLGDGPVARIGSSADTEVAFLLEARVALDAAESALRDAEDELAAATSTREVARDIAKRMDTLAEDARAEADSAARVYVAASHGDGASISSMGAVFGSGHDLLAGLGGVARVEQIAGDAKALQKIASKRADRAEATEERALEAWDAVDEVPVEFLEEEVAFAEEEVEALREEFSGLEAEVASSSVALVDSLPRDAGQLSEQGWAPPVGGRITDGFGPRPNKPLPGVNEFHRGTDVAASCGSPVFAATGGIVLEARGNGGYGNWILVEHGAGVSTGYAHLDNGGILVQPGQSVTAGQLIGTVGSTGASTGCHLHFEVRLDGMAVDAVPFMAARGIAVG